MGKGDFERRFGFDPTNPQAKDDRMKITQEISTPVHVLQDAEGNRQIVRDHEDQVCLKCPCCVLWAVALQAMHNDIVTHTNAGHSRANRDMKCNVCLMASGAFNNPKGP